MTIALAILCVFDVYINHFLCIIFSLRLKDRLYLTLFINLPQISS